MSTVNTPTPPSPPSVPSKVHAPPPKPELEYMVRPKPTRASAAITKGNKEDVTNHFALCDNCDGTLTLLGKDKNNGLLDISSIVTIEIVEQVPPYTIQKTSTESVLMLNRYSVNAPIDFKLKVNGTILDVHLPFPV